MITVRATTSAAVDNTNTCRIEQTLSESNIPAETATSAAATTTYQQQQQISKSDFVEYLRIGRCRGLETSQK